MAALKLRNSGHRANGDSTPPPIRREPICARWCTRARLAIPAFHYTVALSGAASIPCAPYATFGSAELAASVVDTLGEQGRACLMANHGILCAGTDLDAALSLAVEVEYLAQVYTLTLQTGNAVILDDEEMQRVLERVRDYGQTS